MTRRELHKLCAQVGSRQFTAARKAAVRTVIANEQVIRGLLRPLGLKIGAVTRVRFEARIRQLVATDRLLLDIFEPLLQMHRCLRENLADLHRLVLRAVRVDPICRRLMTMPGIGPVTALTYRATKIQTLKALTENAKNLPGRRARIVETIIANSNVAELPRSTAAVKTHVLSAIIAPNCPNLIGSTGMPRLSTVRKQIAIEDLTEGLCDISGSAVLVVTQLAAVVEAGGYEKCVEAGSLRALDVSIYLIADH